MFKVTNKSNDTRKFRDTYTGKDVLVEAKKSVLAIKPPMESDIWKVEPADKPVKAEEKPKTINHKEDE